MKNFRFGFTHGRSGYTVLDIQAKTYYLAKQKLQDMFPNQKVIIDFGIEI